MKIGVFTESYLPDPNGIATTVAASARELEKMGHTVYIIAPSHPGYKDKKNVIRLYSFKMYRSLDMRTALHLPEKNLIKVLRLDLDIIHGHGGGSVSFLGWEIARLKNIQYIATYHTFAHEYTHYVLRGKVVTPAIVKTATRIFGNMCEQLIAPTDRAKKVLRKLGVKTPITILPNGIDRTLFEVKNKQFLREKLKITANKKILLYAGRLGQEKSVDFLLTSFVQIHKNNPNTVLVLVGDGPDKKALKKLAQKLNIQKQVYFTGFIKGHLMPSVYAGADLFVFASKTETQGMVLIEAMTSGLPVVAVYDKAFRDLIQNDYNGYLTKRSNIDFAKTVTTLLASYEKCAEMGMHAKESTIQFSLQKSTQDLEALYKELYLIHKTRKDSPIRYTFRGAKKIIDILST